MGKVQQQNKSKPSRLNFVDEGSQTKGRDPPEGRAGGEKKRKPKLKSDAQKAKERAEQLRFGKAEITVDEASRMTKEQKREMYASAALLSAAHREVEQYEDDNVGIKSAHEAEKGAELTGRISDSRYSKKLKKRGKLLKTKVQKKPAAEKPDETGSNPISRAKQRQAYQQQARATAQAARTGTADYQVSATHSEKKTSEGDFQPKHFLGRELIKSTTF